MKKSILLICIIAIFMTFNVAFATAIGVEIIPDGGPGVGASAGQNDAVTEFKQYDLNEKFVYVMDNGCRVECPINVNTSNGMVSTKNYNVTQSTYDGNWYLRFDYTGLKSKTTKFYIKAKNVEGVMIDLKEINVGYHSEYNPRNGKIKYKAESDSCSYKIPSSAILVEVLGVIDNY